jgi:hypothetical protein
VFFQRDQTFLLGHVKQLIQSFMTDR